MFPTRLTPAGLPPLACSSSGAVMMPAAPSMDLPPRTLATLFDSSAPSDSLPLDPSVPFFNPLQTQPSRRPFLPHQHKALDIAAALAHRTLPLHTQKQMLDKTLATLAAHRLAAATSSSSASSSSAHVRFRPYAAPTPGPKRLVRPTVPSLPVPRTAAAFAAAAAGARGLHEMRASPVPVASALEHAAARHWPRPITPPTTAGGRVIPGFTPLPDVLAGDNYRTPERRSPKSPEAAEDGADRMDVDEGEAGEDEINVPDGGFGQSLLEIEHYDVGMTSLIGDDEDY